MNYFVGIAMLLLPLTPLRAQDTSSIWTFSHLVNYALDNNISIQQSSLDAQTALANYKQARSNRLPSISGSASYRLSNGSSIDQITNTWSSNITQTNNFGISSSMTLYQGNKLNLNIQKSALQLEANDLYIEEAKNDITIRILEAYMNAMYANEAITIAQNTLDASQVQLEQGKTRYANGDIARSELAELETQFATSQSDVVNAEQNYRLKVLNIKQLLELDQTASFDIVVQMFDEPSLLIPDIETVYTKAEQVLPTLKIYDNLIAQAEKDLALSKTGYLPTVTLTAGISTGYTDNIAYSYVNQLNNNVGEYIGVGVSIPIFSKRQNKTNVTLSQIAIEQSELNKTQASKDLYLTVETAWQNAVSSEALSASSKTARDNARLAYELASKSYEFGSTTPSDLVVSRNTYLNAEHNYLQNKYMALLYLELLNYYQGEPIMAQ